MKALLLLVFVALPVHAALDDDLSRLTEERAVRIAFGDLPGTTALEASGQWNGVAYATGEDAVFLLPAGAVYDGAACSCDNHTVTRDASRFTLRSESGPSTFAFRYHFPGATTLGLTIPGEATPVQVIVYTPPQYTVTTALAGHHDPLPATDGSGRLIHSWTIPAGQGQSAWFALHPVVATSTPGPAMDWTAVGLGLVIGMLVWALLVSRGVVQKARKQVVATAKHVEVAQGATRDVLEARKRALLAGITALEAARQDNQIDEATLATVRGELKTQAVTVMRALEESKPR